MTSIEAGTAAEERRDALVARLAGRILREPVPGWCAGCQANGATMAAIVTVLLLALEEEGRLIEPGDIQGSVGDE